MSSETAESNMYGASDPSDRVVLAAPELRHVVYTFAPPESEITDSLSSSVAEMAAADDTELVAGEEETRGAAVLGTAATGRCSRIAARIVGQDDRQGPPADRVTRRFACARRSWVGPNRMILSREICRAGLWRRSLDASADADPLAGILDRDEVPEVVWFELRYYDGTSWQSSWDSHTQGRLPVAVEMRFELQVAEPAEEMPTAGRGDRTRRGLEQHALRKTCRCLPNSRRCRRRRTRRQLWEREQRPRLLTIVVWCSWRRRTDRDGLTLRSRARGQLCQLRTLAGGSPCAAPSAAARIRDRDRDGGDSADLRWPPTAF